MASFFLLPHQLQKHLFGLLIAVASALAVTSHLEHCRTDSDGLQSCGNTPLPPGACLWHPDAVTTCEFEVLDAEFLKVLGKEPKLEFITDGPANEGGVYFPDNEEYYFSSNWTLDGLPANPANLMKLSLKTGDISLVMEAKMANGMALDNNGELVICEQGLFSEPGLVQRVNLHNLSSSVVADNWAGLPFNSPNDVVVKSDGSIWFTDPNYGETQGFKGPQQIPNQVYRVSVTGEVTVVADGFAKPNGLAFSQDEKLLYITDTGSSLGYWCCFGPDDYRGEAPKSHPKRRATKGKHFVGCQCHFVVSQLYQFPNVARINYIQYQHIDGSDNICHGELYDGPMNKFRFAPWLSLQIKEWVCNLLQRGFTPQQVFSQHIQRVERCSMDGTLSSSRDLFLTMRDILNITCMMENVSLHTHQDDAISVNNWVIDNPHQVFYYQVMNERKEEAFILGIQTQWQLQMLSKYGHDGLLAMDATFGTNKYKFYLYTILVFDAFRNGVPIAWTITSSASCVNITKWLSALRNRVLDINKGWEPNAFMVDDAEADIQALRKVFGIGIPILLCIWHVRRAWLKNLIKKVIDASTRADMFKHLGLIMNRQSSLCKSLQDKESEAHKLLLEFMEKYESEVMFIDYFKREWLPRIGMWIRSCRVMKIANQDTNGSIESYHGVLKSKFLGGKRSIRGRRVDWLLKMLVGSCHSYFWYQEMLKDSGFKKNFKVMDVAKNSLARAMEIPDEYVRFHGDNYKHAKVLSLTKQLYFHTVLNADTQWDTCTCDWAERGNLCKHQVKVMMLIGIDIRTIIDKGVNMYNKSLNDETKSMQCNIKSFDTLDDVNPIEHVDIPPNGDSSCKDTGGKDYVALIQQNVLQSLQIAGDDAFLLEHVLRRSMHMLTSTQEMKASESRMPLHPCGELKCIEDGFGTSLKRAKPFIEKGGRKRNKPCKEHGQEVTSFPTCPKTKRSTMQNQLDKHARVDKDNI